MKTLTPCYALYRAIKYQASNNKNTHPSITAARSINRVEPADARLPTHLVTMIILHKSRKKNRAQLCDDKNGNDQASLITIQ